jgi:hypothetical protein
LIVLDQGLKDFPQQSIRRAMPGAVKLLVVKRNSLYRRHASGEFHRFYPPRYLVFPTQLALTSLTSIFLGLPLPALIFPLYEKKCRDAEISFSI